jgi:serine/threonine protein phosphatase PrpC
VYPNYSVCVVADGHGSKKHFRSDVGSKYAVQSSLEAIADFLTDFDTFCKIFKDSPEKIIKMMQKNIISRWNDKIYEHYQTTPITDKEKSPFTDDEFKSIKMESYYGTTLIVGVMCSDFSFGLQLGDGSLVVVNEIGEVEMPIVDDETHPANVTASMCNSNAIELFDSFYTFTRPTGILVSTDGLYTSFNSRQSFEEYNLIAISMLENVEEAEKSIKANLEKRTRYGSRDDISLSVVFDERRRKSRLRLIQDSLESIKKNADMEKVKQMARRKKQTAKNVQESEVE